MNLKRVRYKQRDFSLDDIDELKQINWNLEKYGCGPTSIANVLVNLGFKINPIDTAKNLCCLLSIVTSCKKNLAYKHICNKSKNCSITAVYAACTRLTDLSQNRYKYITIV